MQIDEWEARCDLAAAFRWTARLDMHEGVANHFSLALTGDRRRFLINPDKRHFARIRASDLVTVDLGQDGRPASVDPTAAALHGALHRQVTFARCAMHVHSPYATVLTTFARPELPPVDQTSAAFFNRVVVDPSYGGLALGDEAARCAALFEDPARRVMLMGNHGLLVVGDTVAETFDRMYYFERAAATYVRALQTGQPLRVLSDAVAEKTAQETAAYDGAAEAHLREIRALLDDEGSDYAT